MEFIIRTASEADVPGIMKIMKEAEGDSLHPEWFVADDEAFVNGHLTEHGFIIVSETEEGEIAGFFIIKYPEPGENLGTYLDYSEEKLLKTVIMDSAAVGSAYRGNRLQDRMLKAAEKKIDKRKYKYLLCTVHPDNQFSLYNMQKNGYMIKLKTQCYGGLTRYILEKIITNKR